MKRIAILLLAVASSAFAADEVMVAKLKHSEITLTANPCPFDVNQGQARITGDNDQVFDGCWSYDDGDEVTLTWTHRNGEQMQQRVTKKMSVGFFRERTR
jgi:uncharacterized membrane protein